MSRYYQRNGEPYPNDDVLLWAKDFENIEKKRVARNEKNGIVVSTVWMGLDHRFGDEGKPLIFESMVFNDEGDEQVQERYSTEQESIEGHKKLVNKYLK